MVIAWSNIEREDPSKSRGKTQNIGDTVEVAKRAIAREKGEKHVPTGYFLLL